MAYSECLADTKWRCQYHIVFVPKYRRKIFYGEKREEIGKILRELCGWKGGDNHRSRSMPRPHAQAYMHPTRLKCSTNNRIVKGKSSFMIWAAFNPKVKI